MESNQIQEGAIIRELGDGLILRRASRADAQKLADFNAHIHRDREEDDPNEYVGTWTHDLLAKPHPVFQPQDFTIVEDTNTGEIVSSLNLISQTWSYDGITFGVGRPELVGTLPEYRNRGLVRAQFETIHQWSAERGEKVQAITGIPYYYRLFGYEMTVDLGGGRAGYTPNVPKLKKDEQEPFHFRPAGEADIPLIMELYEKGARRSLVSCVWDRELWQYEINGKSEKNVNRSELRIIETPEGSPVGVLGHPVMTWGPMMVCNLLELKPGVSIAEVAPSVVRYLMATGKALAAKESEEAAQEFSGFGFWMGKEHPVYDVLNDRLPRVRKPYAWYIRVPNLPDFLQTVRPVLERRLAESPLNGHNGELKLTFYRDGLRMAFEAGKIKEVESWRPTPVGHNGDAGFPGLTFLQLLFGYRSFEELSYAFPDVWNKDDQALALLNTLFPKQFSRVWPVS